ncbi:hypothetical protein BS47DRAFT_1347679, partial [Hydnum rufescens UP504]
MFTWFTYVSFSTPPRVLTDNICRGTLSLTASSGLRLLQTHRGSGVEKTTARDPPLRNREI